MQQNSAFKGIKLLDTRMWPTSSDSLYEFGNSEVLLVIEHFRELFQMKVTLMSERGTFKAFWLSNLRDIPKEEVWSMLFTTLESKYPNLVHLFELLMVFPVSNAKVKCGFSTMRRIKSD